MSEIPSTGVIKMILWHTDKCNNLFPVDLDKKRIVFHRKRMTKVLSVFDRFLYFDMYPYVAPQDLINRIELCDWAMSLYKTKISKHYRRWDRVKLCLIKMLTKKLDIAEAIKYMEQQKDLNEVEFRNLLNWCKYATSYVKGKKREKWIELEISIKDKMLKVLKEGEAKVDKLNELISTIKNDLKAAEKEVSITYKSIKWMDEFFLQKVTGDGSCDECRLLHKPHCNKEECQAGKFVFKLSELIGVQHEKK